jgi:MFS family permease
MSAEHATSRRGLWASFTNAGAPSGMVLSTVALAGAAAIAGEQGFLAWGWRLPFLLSAVLLGIGGVLTFLPLAYLFRATRARVPIGRLALIVAAVGAAGYGVGQAVSLGGTALGAADFADGADRSNEAATEALANSTASTARLVAELGGLSLAIAFVMIGLGAMRAGLLSRLMGILGAIVGASLVLPLDQLGIIRSFWLAALGALILGLRVIRRPPAWAVAEAVPWPSQQEVREQREAARRARDAERGRQGAGASAKTSPRAERVPQPRAPQPRRAEPAGARPHSASKKRKRKRR